MKNLLIMQENILIDISDMLLSTELSHIAYTQIKYVNILILIITKLLRIS